MPQPLEVTVGPKDAMFLGRTHLALQAAVDYVARLGGGTVRIEPGQYDMGNSLFMRERVRVVGMGDDTTLRKCPSACTKLISDIDWYTTELGVEDPTIFSVGGGILLRGKSVHCDHRQFVKRTVAAIRGNVITLDRDPRENFWIDNDATASTLFPVITANDTNDFAIESLTIDGNRAQNENLNGNYGGGIFLQDCDRVLIRDVTTRDNNGDGISWQVCDDVRVEGCRSFNNADLGMHPGSGSQRPVVIGNTIRGCGLGFFFCWGVKHGLVEDNDIEDSAQYGVSIGHRDTDNIVRNNRIRRSAISGVHFREHPMSQRDPHRNLFEGNLIEDSGTKGDCVAIEMLGATEDTMFRGNRIVDTRRKHKSRNRIGLRIGPRIGAVTLEDNVFEGMEQDFVDQRS